MPYLHWETDRKRSQFTDWIGKVTKKFNDNQKEEDMKKRNTRIVQRKMLPIPQWLQHMKRGDKNRTPTWDDPLMYYDIPKRNLRVIRREGRVISENSLGQYLLDAAKLYESMTNYRDEQLLAKYLHRDPPLHPRRTLDQAYYGSLDNTESRDRDQVVYRATKSTGQKYHDFDPETKEWKQHRDHDIGDGCSHCRSKIRKVSRLVMVDQLWMWILDATTVLTFFPRRYGANKHDNSGVHKSIRKRLKSAPKNRIRSAFDLGLLIIEECSSTFFDRTKNPDPKQPQVIDQFAQAIADVVSLISR